MRVVALLLTSLIFYIAFMLTSKNVSNNDNVEPITKSTIFTNTIHRLKEELPINSSNLRKDKFPENEDFNSNDVDKYLAEFIKGNYSNILHYHNIVTVCAGVPKNEQEHYDWSIEHGNDEDLDVEYMDLLVSDCSNVDRPSYRAQESLYWSAIDSGEAKAGLALAKLMPFHSEEKVKLLMNAIFVSNNSIELLAEISLETEKNAILMSDLYRYFWLSISDTSKLYPNKSDILINEFHSRNTVENMDFVNTLINDWKQGNVEGKKVVLLKLSNVFIP